MQITALAGGIGGARFLRGLLATLAADGPPDSTVTVVVNTGDDITVQGLRVCPDLDSVMYTLGGGISEERGWGREGETFVVKSELADYGFGPDWFGLGDRDIATHLVRTQLLDAGEPLSAVTAALCARWQPGLTMLPMTDDRVETHVVIDRPETGRREAVHFQEWWLRYRAGVPAHAIVGVGAENATPAPGVLAALAGADVVLIAPSNPVVSVGTILAIPGIRAAIVGTAAPVVGLSPIIGGSPVRGMADACLDAIGVETTAAAVGTHYGAHRNGGLLDGWLVDEVDTGATVAGVTVRAVPLWMHDLDTAAAMARAALELAADLAAPVPAPADRG